MEERYRHIIEQSAESTIAPALVEFVKWILRSAGEHGIRRIYFLARDGPCIRRQGSWQRDGSLR